MPRFDPAAVKLVDDRSAYPFKYVLWHGDLVLHEIAQVRSDEPSRYAIDYRVTLDADASTLRVVVSQDVNDGARGGGSSRVVRDEALDVRALFEASSAR